jgi:hypothetical protein
MNKIQEAWEETEVTIQLEDWVVPKYKSHLSKEHIQRIGKPFFEAGYKAGQDSLKCCGCCKWYTIMYYGTCTNGSSGYYDPDIDFNCDKWEARE